MKRFFFHFIVTVSLMLCVSTVALWVRSYWIDESIFYGPGPFRCCNFSNDQGQIQIGYAWRTDGYEFDRGFSYASGLSNVSPPLTWWQRWCFGGFDYNAYFSRFSWRMVLVPHWFVLLVCGLPVLWIRRWQQQNKPDTSLLCLKCGYDLRASPDRCPECGTPIPADMVRATIP